MKAGGYESGKLFASTLQEAIQFGKYNFGLDGIPNTIMKVRVPNSVLNGATKFGADGVPENQNLLSDVQDFVPNMMAEQQVSQFVVSGNVGIGIINSPAKLAVNGDILAKEVRVKNNISVPDYVFESDYELPTLADVDAYVKKHKHLPEIPSASDIEKDGLDLAEMNLLLLKKVEELTLHLIDVKKENEEQENQIKQLMLKIDGNQKTN